MRISVLLPLTSLLWCACGAQRDYSHNSGLLRGNNNVFIDGNGGGDDDDIIASSLASTPKNEILMTLLEGRPSKTTTTDPGNDEDDTAEGIISRNLKRKKKKKKVKRKKKPKKASSVRTSYMVLLEMTGQPGEISGKTIKAIEKYSKDVYNSFDGLITVKSVEVDVDSYVSVASEEFLYTKSDSGTVTRDFTMLLQFDATCEGTSCPDSLFDDGASITTRARVLNENRNDGFSKHVARQIVENNNEPHTEPILQYFANEEEEEGDLEEKDNIFLGFTSAKAPTTTSTSSLPTSQEFIAGLNEEFGITETSTANNRQLQAQFPGVALFVAATNAQSLTCPNSNDITQVQGIVVLSVEADLDQVTDDQIEIFQQAFIATYNELNFENAAICDLSLRLMMTAVVNLDYSDIVATTGTRKLKKGSAKEEKAKSDKGKKGKTKDESSKTTTETTNNVETTDPATKNVATETTTTTSSSGSSSKTTSDDTTIDAALLMTSTQRIGVQYTILCTGTSCDQGLFSTTTTRLRNLLSENDNGNGIPLGNYVVEIPVQNEFMKEITPTVQADPNSFLMFERNPSMDLVPHNRRLMDTEDLPTYPLCLCPDGAEQRGPFNADFFAALSEYTDIMVLEGDLWFIQGLLASSGLEEVPCNADVVQISWAVRITVLIPEGAVLSEADLQILADAYVDAYNIAQTNTCDTFFRVTVSATVTDVVLQVTRNLATFQNSSPSSSLSSNLIIADRDLQTVVLVRVDIFIIVTGRCLGCPADTKLTNDTNRRGRKRRDRRRLDLEEIQQVTEHRRLVQQTDETCYCPSDPIRIGAPTDQEVLDVLDALVMDLVIDGTITTNITVVDTEEVSDETTLPSATPSAMPSIVPSTMPSAAPSPSPSIVPSVTPSIVPSTMPSYSPSHVPSVTPSTVPSSVPSDAPSVAPTSCLGDPTSVDTFITAYLSLSEEINPAEIAESELQLVVDTYVDAYNIAQMNETTCDPFYRMAINATVQSANSGEIPTHLFIAFPMDGVCYEGCEPGIPFLEETENPRHRELGDLLSNSLSTMKDITPRRKLTPLPETGCVCPDDTVVRAPTNDEVYNLFREMIIDLFQVGDLTKIDDVFFTEEFVV